MVDLTGRCLCGGVKLKIHGAIIGANHCHCESCRRATSSPVTSFFTVATGDGELEGDAVRFFASSAGVRRGFCGNCGSPLSYESDQRPGEIDFYVMLLEEPAAITMRQHDHWGERVGWLTVADDLPKDID
ncbi:hypothetical protein DFR52_104276 [Hoeflea marina]|uniref:CENP-V/GFA domain-containing protein n=1 Tax=Hoeflea marina TaxID=274592 RepID=A0A317PG06_9HYPH|nr:GFA family protein [Hoeflea marina]PWV98985.1 hypothetical protein DFR52_104276 [Hoeflea marina]